MLNKHNFSIASLINADAMAPLNGLLVSPGSTIEVDGMQMVRVTAPESQPNLFPADDGINAADEFTPFVLDKESALKLAKIMPKPKDGVAREMAVVDISTEADGTATVACNDDGRRVILKSEKLEGKFPDCDRIFPETDNAKFEIHFNSDMLVPVLQAFQKFGPTLTLRIYDVKAGMRIDAECDGQLMSAVVMPMRQIENG